MVSKQTVEKRVSSGIHPIPPMHYKSPFPKRRSHADKFVAFCDSDEEKLSEEIVKVDRSNAAHADKYIASLYAPDRDVFSHVVFPKE